MALLNCDFFSEVLEVGTSMTVVLPQSTESQIGCPPPPRTADEFPVLYLLHGLSDDHSAWSRYTSIERYAAAAGLAVVMPAVGAELLRRRGATDTATGSSSRPSCPRSWSRSSGCPRRARTPSSRACRWVATAP